MGVSNSEDQSVQLKARVSAGALRDEVSDTSFDSAIAMNSVDWADSGSENDLLMRQLEPLSADTALAPFHYVSGLSSKDVRGQLIDALNVWIGLDQESLVLLRKLIQDIHNTSLLLDDVQDNSPLRRGKPAAHTVFGPAQTINSATYKIIEIVSQAMSMTDSTEYVRAVVDGMSDLMIGQSLDLLWTQEASFPTVQEYIRMVDGKTGGLFRMVANLMLCRAPPSASGLAQGLERFMTLLGRYFQIRDDYANLAFKQYTDAKGFCEDLDEGKCSFVLLHAFEHTKGSSRDVLRNIVHQRRANGTGLSFEHKTLVLDIIENTGSLDWVLKQVRDLQDALLANVDAMETSEGKPNPQLRVLIEKLLV